MLTDQQLLSVWELGYQRSKLEQATMLVSSVFPELNQEEIQSMAIGKRDGLLMRLRRSLFGNRCDSLTSCPECAEQLEINFSIADLIQTEALSATSTPRTNGSYRKCVDNFVFTYRLLTGRDAMECLSDSTSERPASERLLQKSIIGMERNGKAVTVDSLSTEEKDLIAEEVSKQDPLSNVRFELECSLCSTTWTAPFDIIGFLWTEISNYCQRLLSEIHFLARFYSWSEKEILSLSRWRRQIYLNMARQQ